LKKNIFLQNMFFKVSSLPFISGSTQPLAATQWWCNVWKWKGRSLSVATWWYNDGNGKYISEHSMNDSRKLKRRFQSVASIMLAKWKEDLRALGQCWCNVWKLMKRTP
jgi:hypothetical protein